MAADDLESDQLAQKKNIEVEDVVNFDLHTACSLGDLDFGRQLVKEGANINSKNKEGWSPLMVASWSTRTDVVEFLIQSGAYIFQLNNEKQTSLLIASKAGCLPILKLVFQNYLKDLVDFDGKTALYYAVQFGYHDVSQFLINQQADVNISCRGMTPLMVAAVNGHRSTVEQLLAAGANKFALNSQGFTAQQLAQQYGHTDLAHLLHNSDHTYCLVQGEKFTWPSRLTENKLLEVINFLSDNSKFSLQQFKAK